jgi:cytochrome c6
VRLKLPARFSGLRTGLIAGSSLLIMAAAPRDGTALAADGEAGAQVFMQSRCFVCHGELGTGGAGPKFRDNPFLQFSDYVVGQILLGRGIMPSFADKLDDQHIAVVASYIRNSLGRSDRARHRATIALALLGLNIDFQRFVA